MLGKINNLSKFTREFSTLNSIGVTHALVARITDNHTRTNGAGTVLVPGFPISLAKSGFGFLYLQDIKSIVGTERNSCSNSFWTGSMENTPSSWDVDESSQQPLTGLALIEKLAKKALKNQGIILPHNEVVATLQENLMLITTNPGICEKLASFRDAVSKTHNCAPHIVYYSAPNGKLHLVENDVLKDFPIPDNIISAKFFKPDDKTQVPSSKWSDRENQRRHADNTPPDSYEAWLGSRSGGRY